LSNDKKKHILGRLTAAEGLERFLHTKYVGQKRFSLEGGESFIAAMDEIIQSAGAKGVQEIVIGMAHRGRLNVFVRNLQNMINNNQLSAAVAECDKQKGSLANVMKAGLQRYSALQSDTTMDKEQKVVAMQKELEEATALELPMLSKNLVIISTCASIATLVGLIGTVLGMIKAFSALAQAGAPDAVALANGISEALINTALGISGSTVAIIMYNYFTTQIDSLTYKIDESGYSLVSTFEASTK
jgi:biopolymer transport protein ExbB